MADYEWAFEKVMANEGGYILHTVQEDRGGMTFAGISRHYHPKWKGWKLIDKGKLIDAKNLVKEFYKQKFWNAMKGDYIIYDDVAMVIFDFAVNSGIVPAVKLAQKIIGVQVDGIVGGITVGKINNLEDPHKFVLAYSLMRIERYKTICERNETQKKFLIGWINRVLKEVKIG